VVNGKPLSPVRTPFACHETCPLVVRSAPAAGRVGATDFSLSPGRVAASSPGCCRARDRH
jgi:hypothetical protein